MKILVENLHTNALGSHLFCLFRKFGPVIETKVFTDIHGNSIGHGHVIMKNEKEGKQALSEMNNYFYMGLNLETTQIFSSLD